MIEGGNGTEARVVDLPAIAQAADRRLAWSAASEDLQLNLLVLVTGEAVEEHLNAEVDVLLVGVEGSGAIEVEGVRHTLEPGQALIVPKGTRRSIAGTGDRFAYLSCHRRRGGLWPVRRESPGRSAASQDAESPVSERGSVRFGR
jgi:mannose-6-phosphate isomerase-like protein (cupin superfamily)